MRIVLDTSALIAGLRSSTGAAGTVLKLVHSKEVILCLDYKLSCEYRDVAARSEHRRTGGWSLAAIHTYLSTLEDGAESIRMRRRFRGISPDPADDMVLEVAINGRVDVIVTNNLRHLREAAQRFGVEVLTPGQFLERIRMGGNNADGSEDESTE